MSDTLVAMFRAQVERSRERPALRTKKRGRWQTTTFGAWAKRSRALGQALCDRGIAPGDRVAIMASTREEWLVCDLAVLLAGAVSVPIYPTSTEADAAFVLSDSGARLVFAEDVALARRLAAGQRGAEKRAEIVLFDGYASGATSLAELERKGAASLRDAGVDRALTSRGDRVLDGDLATIVYTSGTTGRARGVMLTHANLCAEVRTLGATLGIGARDHQLLFLPLSHIFGRLLALGQLHAGYVTSFAESMATALDDLTAVEPTFFGSVPRLFEKIHDVALLRGAQSGATRERLFRWAMDTGAESARTARAGKSPSLALSLGRRFAGRLVLDRIRDRFGRNLRFALSAGAPLPRELGEWFHAAGVLILEAYGLTETTGAATINREKRYRFGTVGEPLAGVEVSLADDGEVLVRGPNVMRGYWGLPEETDEAIDREGWLHTGDVGQLTTDRMVRITDRKKDLLVTAGGKNVAPQKIEACLLESPWIAQAMVYGDRRPYLVALVTLDLVAVSEWAREQRIDAQGDELALHPEVRGLVESEIDRVNRKLASFETIKRFLVVPHELTIEGGELTPTLKIRRAAVCARFAPELDRLYQ